ncbi:hemerythrin domain-containing protein [Rhodococcus sp. UNC363MFTsu5.1]|uniref:hemerythrin domain-containing protein n=1 Tax=Rhodococcus sp. UNC363MFTsu5.1 TaxID=1449069 RepID=UPI000566E7D8|nr:hemerythrin domain-containing protein [Rhodococcus sp. UNC363MFTsu5.1]
MSSPTTHRPTSDEDLLGMRLAHRVMRRDAARLARVADELVADPSGFDARRRGALAAYLDLFLASIHHHHTVEDEALWPLIVASAGPHTDLTELTDDHRALDPLLDEIRGHAHAGPDHAAAVGLAASLRQLRDLLDEHIEDEERTVFPLVTGFVPADAWARFEQHAQRGGRMGFELTRAFAVMTPDELAWVRGRVPMVVRGIVFACGGRQRRRERLVFGVEN